MALLKVTWFRSAQFKQRINFDLHLFGVCKTQVDVSLICKFAQSSNSIN